MIGAPLILKVLLLIFLFSTMMGAGLGLTVPALVAPLRDLRLVLTSLALSFVAAPALALLLVRLIPLAPAQATGLLLLGGAAGAPFLPKLVEVADGDLAVSVALMTLLTAGTTLFLPLALPWLAPGLEANPWEIARPLLLMVLLPLVAGLFGRRHAPAWAARWQPGFGRLSTLSGLAMLALLLFRDLRSVGGILGSGAGASVAMLIAGLFVLGYAAGGARPRARGLMGIVGGSRHVGAALVPATQAGVDPEVATMLVTGTLVMIVVLLAAIGGMRYAASVRPTSHDPA